MNLHQIINWNSKFGAWEFHIREIPIIRLFQINSLETQKLFVTSIIIFFIMIFIILSGFWEHCPSRINYATFFQWIQWFFKSPPPPPSHSSCFRVKKLTLSHSLQKKQKIEADWGLIFFNCYLTAPLPTLGHFWGDILTHPMLFTAF